MRWWISRTGLTVASCRPVAYMYSGVSFCDGSFYNDSLLRPLPRQTVHSWLVHHCRNSSVLSLHSALLALFRCACVPSSRQIILFYKKERKEQGRLTLQTKMLVIRKMEAGGKRANVCSSLGLAVATVTTNAEKIKQSFWRNSTKRRWKRNIHC